MQGIKRWVVVGVIWIWMAGAGYAQYATQTITLAKG